MHKKYSLEMAHPPLRSPRLVIMPGRYPPANLQPTFNPSMLDDIMPKTFMPKQTQLVAKPQIVLLNVASSFATQTESKLLSLPPELRNMIYDFVLSGNTIHVHQVGRKKWTKGAAAFRYRVCVATASDSKLIATLAKLKDDAEPEFETYEDRHSACEIVGPRSNNFPRHLLYTCRQIYLETKHLPLGANTFAFNELEDSISFQGYVNPIQLGKIKSITLSGRTRGMFDIQSILAGRSAFVNLTKVQIFKEIQDSIDAWADLMIWQIAGKSIDDYGYNDEGYDTYRPIINRATKRFKSATICIHYPPGGSPVTAQADQTTGHDPQTRHLPLKFSREMEAVLMADG